MQLGDITKSIEDMTDEELEARLREIRNRRDVVRPAAKNHAKRAESKGRQTRVSKVADMFAGMSQEEKEAIIAALEG